VGDKWQPWKLIKNEDAIPTNRAHDSYGYSGFLLLIYLFPLKTGAKIPGFPGIFSEIVSKKGLPGEKSFVTL
jgi:hypothetical protein